MQHKGGSVTLSGMDILSPFQYNRALASLKKSQRGEKTCRTGSHYHYFLAFRAIKIWSHFIRLVRPVSLQIDLNPVLERDLSSSGIYASSERLDMDNPVSCNSTGPGAFLGQGRVVLSFGNRKGNVCLFHIKAFVMRVEPKACQVCRILLCDTCKGR